MKLWKENRINQEWELSNKEIAERFLKTDYEKTARNLIWFISDKEGLNSTYDFDKNKGSVNGSEDIQEILDIIEQDEVN